MELFPIWNVADMSIVIGVVGVLLFHRPFHERHYDRPASQEGTVSPERDATRSDGSASSQVEGASSQSVSVPDRAETDNDEASSAEDPVPQSSENWPKDVD
jgi:signal peptidase II